MNQRETLKRLLLCVTTDRPLPDDLKTWLSTGIDRLLTRQDRSWDSALGWNAEPAADLKDRRNEVLRRIARELPDRRIAGRIARRQLPPEIRPLLDEAESFCRIPNYKQLTRILQ